MQGAADETIRVQFVADTAAAVKEAERLQVQLAATRQQLIDLAKQTTASFDQIAKSMKGQRWNELMSEFNVRQQKVGGAPGQMEINKDAMAGARAAYREYADSVSAALRSVLAEEKAVASQRISDEQRLIATLKSIDIAAEKENERLADQRAAYDRKVAQEILKDQEKAAADLAKTQAKAKAAQDKRQLADYNLGAQVQNALIKQGALNSTGNVQLDTQQARANLDVLKQDIVDMATQSGASFRDIGEQMKKTFAADLLRDVKTKPDLKNAMAQIQAFNQQVNKAMREVEQDFKQGEKGAKSLDSELKEKPKDAGAVKNAFSQLGTITKFVFANILGMSAISAIRDFIQWINKAINSGEEFAQSMYKLATSVHALQRVGFNVTMQETVDLIDELSKKFNTFSKKQIADGVAQVQLLTRSFGFTKDQMKQVFEVASTLSVVLGKDFNEAARETALFLSSGYAESMQKAGLAVNRKTVQDEAHRLGIEKSYMAMSEQERSMAALSLLYREIGPLMGDVQAYQKTEIGQMKDITSDYEDMTAALGDRLIPAKLAFMKLLGGVMDVLAKLNQVAASIAESLAYNLSYPWIAASNAIKMYQDGTFSVEAWTKKTFEDVQAFAKKVKEQTSLIQPLDIKSELGSDLPKSEWGSMPLLSPDDSDKQIEIIQKMYQDAEKLRRDYERDYAKAGIDLTKDIGATDPKQLDSLLQNWDNFFSDQSNMTVQATEDQQAQWEKFFGDFGTIINDGLDKAFNIWQDYYNRLDDIARKEQNSIEDENRDYQQSIEDTNRQAQQDAADATQKYHDEELKAEREFQEKMRRLKEQYLFDLEDALRERDALQVLRLMRKYQMDKENAKRDYDLDAQARKEAFERELQDIERQRQRKLEELRIEHERKLQEIRLQADREREEAARNRDQAMEQLKADLEAERQERIIKYDQEIQDLKDRFGDRLTEIFIGLTDEEGMTKDMLDKIGKLYLDMFGQNGMVDMSYQQLQQIVAGAVADAQTAYDQIQAIAEAAAKTSEQLSASAAAAQQTSAALGQIPAANASSYNPYGSGVTTTASPSNVIPKGPTGHAFGGTEYANTPTLAMFGEAGPEIATFTPVSRLNTNNMGLPNPYVGDQISGKSQNAQVVIRLGPGLVAEIVDGAMTGFAQIIEEQ